RSASSVTASADAVAMVSPSASSPAAGRGGGGGRQADQDGRTAVGAGPLGALLAVPVLARRLLEHPFITAGEAVQGGTSLGYDTHHVRTRR
ncbi:hypothetical protein, partial [Actinomadura sp. NPDC049753]|uniref:hypothetical protein n=1 Tax=Actinomadura sp. NPDC049753 TaxID=3154739 RepID=UPI00342FD2C6